MNVVHADLRVRPRLPQARRLRLFSEGEKFEYVVRPYVLALVLMNLIATYVQLKKLVLRAFKITPKTNAWLFDGLSVNGRRMKDGATRWPALNTVYNFRVGEGDTQLARAADNFWMRMRNAQAVRNRLVIVKKELLATIVRVAETSDGRPVKILSLAAGTAQGVIEAVSEARLLGISVEVLLVDNDPSALSYARDLARRYGVMDTLTIHEGNAFAFNRELKGFRADIVEMCGLVDYLREKNAVALMKRIHAHLKPGGFFVTCHIHPNAEAYFLRHAINWQMLYRTPDELENLLVDGGFLMITFYTEPHMIHTVAVAQK